MNNPITVTIKHPDGNITTLEGTGLIGIVLNNETEGLNELICGHFSKKDLLASKSCIERNLIPNLDEQIRGYNEKVPEELSELEALLRLLLDKERGGEGSNGIN